MKIPFVMLCALMGILAAAPCFTVTWAQMDVDAPAFSRCCESVEDDCIGEFVRMVQPPTSLANPHNPQASPKHVQYGKTIQLDPRKAKTMLENGFCGKIQFLLHERLLETAPSTVVTVLLTYDESLSRDEMTARVILGVKDARITFASKFVPVLVCSLPAGEVDDLEGIDGVKHVFASHEVKLCQERSNISFQDLQKRLMGQPRLYLNESARIIGAHELWRLGISGSGVCIAVVDSGVDWTHPDLAGKVLMSVSFVPGEDAMDYFGHGTHVAGIAAGTGAASNGKLRGIAPGASILNIKAFNGSGFSDLVWILRALEEVLITKPHIALMCWGTAFPLPEGHPLNLYMAEFARCGIIPVAAAGNSAYHWTVGSPANSPHVISVGATTKDGRLAFFTSKGPDAYTLRALPTIVAPGVGIVAPVSGWLANYPLSENPYYAELSGTSMAAAHVAGAVALLLSALPRASPNAIKSALMLGADDIGCDVNAMGSGKINVYRAYELLKRGQAIVGFHPKVINGIESPFVARFPGDMDAFNITIFTSTPLKGARLVLTGNASEILSLERYTLGLLEDCAFIGADVTIPAYAAPGVYAGTLELWSLEVLMACTPVVIEVAKPEATVLWDDVHDYIPGYQFLWRWYITCWQSLSISNIRVVSASLSGFKLSTQPLGFNAILLMDPYWSFTEFDIKTLVGYVRGGGNLVVIYGQRADMTRLDEVLRELGIEVVKLRYKYGYPVYSNMAVVLRSEHPAVADVKNFTVIEGWVDLKVSGKAIALASVVDAVYYKTLHDRGEPVPLTFTVMASYEHEPYAGRTLVIGNDYMFDDAWINTWWYIKLPYLIVDYFRAPGNLAVARGMASWTAGDVAPPAISIISPTEGEYLKGVSAIVASAKDEHSGIDRVEFYVNGLLKFRDKEAPYMFDWDTRGLIDGEYIIEAVAYDRAGNRNSSKISVIVDNTRPMLEILSPRNGTFLAGSMTIRFSVFDANLLRVVYSVDGGAPIDATGETSINIAVMPDGRHSIQINAVDKAGNMASETLFFYVDNTRPLVLINAPANWTHVKGAIPIHIAGFDANFEKMELLISGEPVQTWNATGAQTYLWNTGAYADGQYTITVTAYDKAGNLAVAGVTVTVDNTSPIAEIREPAEGLHIRESCTITVYGYDVHINAIELYIDGDLVKAWPVHGVHAYAWDTSGVADGNRLIKLVVRDRAGNVVEKALAVTVDNTPPKAFITAPVDAAEVLGKVIIRFNVSDSSLEKVLLYIGNAVFDVTGTSLYEWDTTRVGDGRYTIKIIAIDKAGNTASAQLTVTTVNLQKAIEESYTAGKEEGYKEGQRAGEEMGYAYGRSLGLTIGTFTGLAIGILIAYKASKRLHLKAKTPTGASQSNPAIVYPIITYYEAFSSLSRNAS